MSEEGDNFFEDESLSSLHESEIEHIEKEVEMIPLELEEEDSDLASYMEESEEEEPSQSQLTVGKVLSMNERLRKVSQNFPREPIPKLERLLFWLHYTVQFATFSMTFGKTLGPIDVNDNDEDFLKKATAIHFFQFYKSFMEACQLMALGNMFISFFLLAFFLKKRLEYYKIIVKSTKAILPPHEKDNHIVFELLKAVGQHKEMHSRGIKADAHMKRTKMEIDEDTSPPYNIITKEVFDPNNKAHVKWKSLVFHPLPSDDDYNNIDPVEGDSDYQTLVTLEQIQGEYPVEEPYHVLVTEKWDKLLRHLHTMMWMEEYVHSYIVGGIPDDTFEQMRSKTTWDEAWATATGSFATKTIDKFSRVKKTTPLIVSRTAEFRDLIKDITIILEKY